MASVQVPLTSTFPSGQVHLAPVGLSRHIKSQDILRHGFDAVEKVKKKTNKKSQEHNLSVWPEMRKTHLFVKRLFVLYQSKTIYFKSLNSVLKAVIFLKPREAQG